MILNKIKIGQFDADELSELKNDENALQMIKEDRLELEYLFEDCGAVWVKEGDGEAYKVGCNYIM